jgi:Family of unknown function (DUF6496)
VLGTDWRRPFGGAEELFIQAVGVFPTGTVLELNTGEVGIVIGQSRFRRLRPEERCIEVGKGRPRRDGQEQKQAIDIGLSGARKKGAKVPRKKK